MIEPRLTSIVLLDGSQLDFLITPEFLTCDLMDMVCAHLGLCEKEYFGLSFIDQTGHRNWLQMEKKILDHDLPKKSGVLILFFSVKFYIESIAYTKDKNAVELFFLQARLLLYQGDLEINNELIFELGALVLQSLFGDYKNDKEAIQNIKTQNILPKHYLANYSQISNYCEPKIINYYKKCSTLNRGQCIVNYLSIIEKLCNYGVHYYEVKDKTSTKWYLGVSYRGIGLYEANNKIIPKKIFPWSKLENLYYRDRKFSIEVHESQSINSTNSQNSINNSPNDLKHLQQQQQQQIQNSAQLNSLNQTGQQSDEAFNPVKVYAWFASIPSLCKSIWLMAVAQHQFYLDKKQNRHNILQFKSLNDLALELNNTTNNHQTKFNVENIEDLSSSNNKVKQVNNTTSNKICNLSQKNATTNNTEDNTKAELLNLFKRQKEILQKNLEIKKKLFENVKMKQKEIQELAQITLNDKAQFNKLFKILAEFRNSSMNTNTRDKNILVDNICMESDIQKKIMFITLNLASDPHVSYIVQKQRREFYEKTKKKLAKLEKKLEKETGPAKDAFLDSKQNSIPPERNENFVNSNSDLKLKQIDEDISPASIHRKDSYRRAQEQKLFLDSSDSNILKQNRMIAARKVKSIINHDQFNNSNNNNQQQKQQTTPINTLIDNQPNNLISNQFQSQSQQQQQHLETNVRVIKLGNNGHQNNNQFLNSNNFIPEEQIKDGLLVEAKPRHCSEELNPNVNTQRGFYLHEEFLDLEPNMNRSNHQNHVYHNNHINHSNQHLPTDFITFRNQRNQRKNTSDSNVKLLADHNFYHVTNRRHINHEFQSRENFACPDLVEPNSAIIKNGFHPTAHKTIAKPYELSDYFKYNSKFKRGMNSSSNSLISLNSSSIGTNEDSGNNNSDKDIIRSNPDLKLSSLVNSPNGGLIQQQNGHKNLQIIPSINNSLNNSNNNQEGNTNVKYDNNIFSSGGVYKSECNSINNISNNLSLNLSIHTAEEFGIEMLEWLNNNEANGANNNTNSLIDSKLTTNATLV